MQQGQQDIDTYKKLLERLLKRWTSWLDKDLFWPSFDGSLEEATFQEKTELIAILLEQIATQTPGAAHIPDNYGAILLDSEIFTVLQEYFLPRANQLDPKSVDKVLTAYLRLLNLICENEPNLVSKLLAPGSDSEPGLMIRMFEALKVWSPNNNPTKLLPYRMNLRLVLSLFVALSINEQNAKLVDDYGPEIIRIIMQKRGKPAFLLDEIRDDSPEQLNMKQHKVLDQLRKSCPKTMQAVSDQVHELLK